MVLDPTLRQIEFAVQQRVTFGASIGQEDADLAVLNASGGPTVLPLHPG